ncbi:MAG: arabinose ABC transporter substrate-binding protein [Spirochaetales bacterium]|nr:arabinose ABC transporter substrate-binding protein [Spirochaetales bacterium]
MKWKFFNILQFAFGLLLIISCHPEKKIKIGFLVKQPEESWFQKEWEFAEQAARDYHFELIKIGATDGEKVLMAMDNIAVQGARGFVICTPDVKLGPAIVTKAKSLGLKVMCVDDRLVGPDGKPITDIPYLGISARKIGENVGQALWDEFKKRNLDIKDTGAIAISFNELETARERVQGAIASLTKYGFPEKQIFDAPQKWSDVEGGFNAAYIILTKNPTIKHWLIFAMNDGVVTGGVRATEGRGFKAEDVIAVGINGMAAAVLEFKKSSATGFFGSFLLQAKVHGYNTAKMMYEWIAEGRKPPMDTRTMGVLITRETYRKILTENGLEDLLK